jgi:hypothetical protein
MVELRGVGVMGKMHSSIIVSENGISVRDTVDNRLHFKEFGKCILRKVCSNGNVVTDLEIAFKNVEVNSVYKVSIGGLSGYVKVLGEPSRNTMGDYAFLADECSRYGDAL